MSLRDSGDSEGLPISEMVLFVTLVDGVSSQIEQEPLFIMKVINNLY